MKQFNCILGEWFCLHRPSFHSIIAVGHRRNVFGQILHHLHRFGRAHHSADLILWSVLPPLDDVWVLLLEFRTALDFKVLVALESSLDVS